jgi:hypothetical protein
MVKTSLIQPKESPKMDAIFNALEDGWPNAKRNRHHADLFFVWGLIGNNAEILRHRETVFVDMPYHGRLVGDNFDKSYWRTCYGGLHNNQKLDVTTDRFESWDVELKPMRSGETILICPSSNTVTQFIYGMSADQWVESMRRSIRMFSNRPIRVRNKPRKNGTSGPSVADVSIEDDLEDCHAVVTSASLASIDALKAGVQVFSTASVCPASWCAERDFSKINNLSNSDNRIELFSNLAWKQFSIEEMRSGFFYEHYSRLVYNQSR